MYEMARMAVEMLIAPNRRDEADHAENFVPDSLHRVLAHELVVRDSTSAPGHRATARTKR